MKQDQERVICSAILLDAFHHIKEFREGITVVNCSGLEYDIIEHVKPHPKFKGYSILNGKYGELICTWEDEPKGRYFKLKNNKEDTLN